MRSLLQTLKGLLPPALRFSLHSLRAQLLLWIALPAAIVLIGVSMLEIRGHEHAMHGLVQERAAGLAQAAAVLIAGRIDHGYATLADAAGDFSMHGTLPDTPKAHFPAGLVLMRANGEIVDSTHSPTWLEDEEPRARVQALIQSIEASEEATQSLTIYNPATQEWLLLQALGTAVEGDFAVLAGAIPLRQLASPELIASFLPDTPLAMWLENREGDVIIELAGNTALRENPATDKTVSIQVNIAEAGWRVMVRESWADLVPPLLRYEGVALLGVLMVILVALLSAYFGLHSIVRPLGRLDQAASQVGWGNYDAVRRPVGGVTEIEDLRLALVRMVDQVSQYQQEMKSYIGAMTLGQEEERKRLARELHDETVQALIALKQQIEWAEKNLAHDSTQTRESFEQTRLQVAERLRRLHPLVAEIIDDLRRHIHGLRPLYLEDLGLVTALEMLIKQTTEQHRLIGDFEVLGTAERDIAPAIELSAFRIAQEALRNVVAHARAEWVHIELIFDEEGMTLRIEDNGVGFDAPKHPHELAQRGHYGLLGIHERVQLHGGRLELESERTKGTILATWLPIWDVDAGSLSHPHQTNPDHTIPNPPVGSQAVEKEDSLIQSTSTR